MQTTETITFDGGYYDLPGLPPVIYVGRGPSGQQAIVTWEGGDRYSVVAAVGREVAGVEQAFATPQDAQAHARALAGQLTPHT